jgi:hypothetical protein
MSLAPFLASGKIDQQRVEISFNEHVLTRLSLRQPSETEYSVFLRPPFLREKNVLELRFADAISPLQLGRGLDARKLAVRVSWMEIAGFGTVKYGLRVIRRRIGAHRACRQSDAGDIVRPNQALERTVDWAENLLSMTSTRKPEAHLALVSGRSACSR